VAASSVVKGTLGFMPPEQMFNRQLTVASDLYSLGATLICLLIGINSTEVGSLMDDTGRINFKHRLLQLSPEFLDWLQKMVEPNFKHRYPSADAALNALIPLEVVQQRNKSKLALTSVGLLTAIAAFSIPLLWIFPEPKTAVDRKRVINAEKLNPQTQVMLTDELESTKTTDFWSLKQHNKVYFAVSATNLIEGEYRGKCKVVNSQGDFVAQSQSYLKTTGDRLNTWCWYNFKQDDKPGNWQFQFYLDGQKVTQNSFQVLP
jgi:serine/threonine protein kinase